MFEWRLEMTNVLKCWFDGTETENIIENGNSRSVLIKILNSKLNISRQEAHHLHHQVLQVVVVEEGGRGAIPEG